MTQTSYRHWKFQLNEMRLGTQGGQAMIVTGGSVVVMQAGIPQRATLYQKSGATTYTSLSQPLTITDGFVEFYTLASTTGHDQVDIFGVEPGGRFFMVDGATDGNPQQIQIDTTKREQVLIVPFSEADAGAAAEFDSGLQLPAGCVVSPFQAVNVTVAESGKTIEWGVLGTPNGFATGVSLTSAVVVTPQSASTTTRGTLIGGSTLDHDYAVNTAIDVSYELSSASAHAQGYLEIPYRLCYAG